MKQRRLLYFHPAASLKTLINAKDSVSFLSRISYFFRLIVGGDIMAYESADEEDEFILLFTTWHKRLEASGFDVPDRDKIFFFPYTDLKEEGNWVHHQNNTPLRYDDWLPGQPNGGRTENCATVHFDKEKTKALRKWLIDDRCYYKVIWLMVIVNYH